jgi:hypothetical protein
MQAFFKVHPGEFLVGDYITRRLKKYDVWVPAKDSGVDLLLTAHDTHGKGSPRAIRLQVKFSRSFDGRAANFKDFVALGWYTLKWAKIRNSRADVWIFVIADFRRKLQFVVVPLSKLKELVGREGGTTRHLYLTVFGKGKDGMKCFDTRGLDGEDQKALSRRGLPPPEEARRDYTAFLNNWECLEK